MSWDSEFDLFFKLTVGVDFDLETVEFWEAIPRDVYENFLKRTYRWNGRELRPGWDGYLLYKESKWKALERFLLRHILKEYYKNR